MSDDDTELARARATLERLTGAGGPIAAKGPHASVSRPELFDQAAQIPSERRSTEHREIIREFFEANSSVPIGRQAVLLAGPPGAGKTTAQQSILTRSGTTVDQWRVLNADDFKDRLLERAIVDHTLTGILNPSEVEAARRSGVEIWPREMAALVHEESSMLMKRARSKAIRRGENVIIDATLGDEEGARRLVRALEDQGYKIRIAHVDGPKAVTAARVDYRWAQGRREAQDGQLEVDTLGGRWVPQEVIETLYRDGDDRSVCGKAVRAAWETSTAVTDVEVYEVTEAAGQPELVEWLTDRRSDGTWGRRHRRGKNKTALTVHAPVMVDPAPAMTSAGLTARCSVCGRPLRSAASIARGAGPGCSEKHATA